MVGWSFARHVALRALHSNLHSQCPEDGSQTLKHFPSRLRSFPEVMTICNARIFLLNKVVQSIVTREGNGRVIDVSLKYVQIPSANCEA